MKALQQFYNELHSEHLDLSGGYDIVLIKDQ
jgi:hypothetical protein